MGKLKEPTDKAVLVAIGAELAAAIREAGWEHQPLSTAAGVGLRSIGWYVAGRDIPLSVLMRLADTMGVDPGALVTRLAGAARNAALAGHLRELGADTRTVTETRRIVTRADYGDHRNDGGSMSNRQDVTLRTRRRRGGIDDRE